MKRKELNSFREKDLDKLIKEASDRRLEIIKAKAEIKGSKEKNLKKVKILRHDLSQILTLVKERMLLEKEGKVSNE